MHKRSFLMVSTAMLALILLIAAGCNPKNNDHKHQKKDDDHQSKHGGIILEWGPGHDYHMEYVRDPAKKQVKVYIYDEEIKEFNPIDSEELTLSITNKVPIVQIKLKAVDPKDGKASLFVGEDDVLATKEWNLKGRIQGKLKGKMYKTPEDFDESKHKKE